MSHVHYTIFLLLSWFTQLYGIEYTICADTEKPHGIQQFQSNYDDHAFFYIISEGDNKTQFAMLTVFEVTGQDVIGIRRLHQMELVNLCQPNSHILCGSGRFFVACDDGYMWRDAEDIENLLVVYDLVRKEKTIFIFENLFTREFFKERGVENGIAFTDWRQRFGVQNQHFNSEEITFRMPLPRARIEKDPPEHFELEIDLLARKVKLEQVEDFVDIQATRPRSPEMDWRKDHFWIYQGPEQKTRLPRLLRLTNFRGHEELVFELNQESREYQQVSADKWIDEIIVASRCHGPIDPELLKLLDETPEE